MQRAAITALTERGLEIANDEQTADVIMNCCGYWCGDPWGESWSRKMQERVLQWKQDAKKVILLPQTFGPFIDVRIAAELKTIVEASDLVCPRDSISHQYVIDICGQRDNVRQFPDYTIDVPAIPSNVFLPHAHSVAIIPNLRMTDKVQDSERDRYILFLQRCIEALKTRGVEPFLLIHEEKDQSFADALTGIQMVLEPDAQKTKWIIGHSHAVISSRYHGILNALYQDVPILATGWCHKFPTLMEEWNMSDRFINTDISEDDLRMQIDRLLDRDAWKNDASTRGNARQRYREQTEQLWDAATLVL